MVLEGQKGGEDDMDLGSNGKKNSNQDEETKEQNQKLQVIRTPMNITSPCRDVIMAAEVIPNKQGGKDHQGNKNDHDNEEQKEGRGGGSNNKQGGGGRGGGRGIERGIERGQQSL